MGGDWHLSAGKPSLQVTKQRKGPVPGCWSAGLFQSASWASPLLYLPHNSKILLTNPEFANILIKNRTVKPLSKRSRYP